MTSINNGTKQHSINYAGPCLLHNHNNHPCDICILDASSYFKDLKKQTKIELQSYLRLKKFNKKDILYKENDKDRHLFILIEGEVKVYKTVKSNKQQIHKLVQIPGDLIACEDLFLSAHGSTAVAIQDTRVCYINVADFKCCSDKHKEINDSLMQAMSRTLNAYIRHISNLGQKSAMQKVASYLVYLYELHSHRRPEDTLVKDSLSRTELADMLGITQRTLIQCLKVLAERSIITISTKAYRIDDIDAIKRISLIDE